MKSINEYIASVEKDKALFPEQLHRVYRDKFIFFDSRENTILDNLANSSTLRQEGLDPKQILEKLIPLHLKVGSWFYCDYEEFSITCVNYNDLRLFTQ